MEAKQTTDLAEFVDSTTELPETTVNQVDMEGVLYIRGEIGGGEREMSCWW